MGREGGPADFHALFETFLEAFDGQTRYERGAFYTPAVLARWTARLADALASGEVAEWRIVFDGLVEQDGIKIASSKYSKIYYP